MNGAAADIDDVDHIKQSLITSNVSTGRFTQPASQQPAWKRKKNKNIKQIHYSWGLLHQSVDKYLNIQHQISRKYTNQELTR